MEEKNYRRTAKAVGALFILATIASIATAPLLGTNLDGKDFLLGVDGVKDQLRIAAALEIILAVSLIAIGTLMFPILKKSSESLAWAYAGIRTTEAVFIAIGTMCLLAIVAMGNDFASGTFTTDAGQIGAMLLSLRVEAILFGTLVFLAVGGFVLNYLMFKADLIPKWLSLWGLVGDAFLMVYAMLGVFGMDATSMDSTVILAAPIGVQEMVFAAYLIIKGFKAPVQAV